jgi:hypothetical protein
MVAEGREEEMMVQGKSMNYISIFFQKESTTSKDSTESTSMGKCITFM